MRAALALVLLCLLPASALADVAVICPPLVRAGVAALADAYTRETGVKVTIKAQAIGTLPGLIASDKPDVVILPPALMDNLAKDSAAAPASRMPLGRIRIGLAVRPGTPHPDISTVEKLRTALEGKTLVYTRPGRGSMEAGIIEKLLQRPDFAGVKSLTVTDVSGVGALARGDGDMAMQGVSAITGQKGIELVGPLPRELNAHVDTDIAVLAHTPDAADAQAFVRYLTRPEAAVEWEKIGLER